MKYSTFFTLAAVGKLAAAHATFQEISVNGKSQGTKGVRGTSNQNNPIYSTASNLASDMMICKGGSKVDGSVSVAGGDKLTLQWHHNNPQSPGDGEDPIAASHKGPIIVWVAKASSNGAGNAWVKIQESGLNGGTWAVDTFRANGGKIDVTLPDLAAGDYLIRSEIIALHEGNKEGAAQFYNGCSQISVTSSGSKAITNGVDITKVYTPTDKGVLFDIYSGATSYTIPGPAVGAGFGASSGAGSAASPSKPAATSAVAEAKPTTLSTVSKPAPTQAAGGAAVAKWGQCGGNGYTGSSTCVSGATCTKQNDYYSQCL